MSCLSAHARNPVQPILEGGCCPSLFQAFTFQLLASHQLSRLRRHPLSLSWFTTYYWVVSRLIAPHPLRPGRWNCASSSVLRVEREIERGMGRVASLARHFSLPLRDSMNSTSRVRVWTITTPTLDCPTFFLSVLYCFVMIQYDGGPLPKGAVAVIYITRFLRLPFVPRWPSSC